MVRIITDTTSGLSTDIAQQYDITVIPQIIHFGSESFLEKIEMDNASFMQRLRTSRELPKTAAPPPELFAEQFKRLVPLGEPILCIHPTAEASGTVRSAQAAKAEFPHADIRIIDTRVIGSPLATMVILAAQWTSAKVDINEIEQRLQAMISRCHVYFLVSTLEFLAKGGRIGGATALLGSILQIKPILFLHDGKVEVLERERTQKRALLRMKELVYEKCPRNDSSFLSVMHAGIPEQGTALATDLRVALNLSQVPIMDVPPAIVVHGGPGILGTAFFTN